MLRKLMMKPLKLNTPEFKPTKNLSFKKEKGSITLEAIIFLSLFISFYMMFISLVQVAKTQIVLQYTINEVAKEISAYSYVLTKAGITGKRLDTAEKTYQFKDDTFAVVDSVKEVGNTFMNGGDVISAAQNTYDKAKDYSATYLKDFSTILETLANGVKTEASNYVSRAIIQEIVKSEVTKQIGQMTNKDADTFLRSQGVVDGIEGLNFDETECAISASGDMPELVVAVTYSIDFNLGFLKLGKREYILTAKTAIW